jgi:hypothetical protein
VAYCSAPPCWPRRATCRSIHLEPLTDLGHIGKPERQQIYPRCLYAYVCSWLGNSPRIAQQSYLLVTEEDFERASGAKKVMVEVGHTLSTNRKIPFVKNTHPLPTHLQKKIASIQMRGWNSVSLFLIVRLPIGACGLTTNLFELGKRSCVFRTVRQEDFYLGHKLNRT